MTTKATIIIGANSEIAKSIASQVIQNAQKQLFVVSRDVLFYQQSQFTGCEVIAVNDYQENSIIDAVNTIKNKLSVPIEQIYICHGILHCDDFMPEKRLQSFSKDTFIDVLNINTITPILWLKNLMPLIKKEQCKVVVFSARVGSINDNQFGGWYSYRASKAALNMLLKSAAIELAVTAKGIKLISFHPGTTDTPLSKPFQKHVPEDKLFTSDFVASQLLKIVPEVSVDGTLSFIDWQGKPIPW